MKIISWNVAGILARSEEVRGLIQEEHPDIVCLQKTRTRKAPVLDGFMLFSDCSDNYSGVATYFRNDLECKFIESDTYHLVLEFERFVLINAYVPYSNRKVAGAIEKRKEWNTWIIDFVKKQTKPVVICGDLNIVHTDLDTFYPSCVRNSGCYYSWERDAYKKLLSECQLTDTFRQLHPDERSYTYFDTMHKIDYRALNQGSRLDYFLVSRNLMPSVEASIILSDFGKAPSVPIMLDLRS